jgi:hypothetical protein
MLDLNHQSGSSPGGPPLAEKINHRIDAGLIRARTSEAKRTYFGASSLGDPCGRYVAYQYRGLQGPSSSEPEEPEDGRTLRIFALGHVLEELLARWLRGAGFVLLTIDPTTDEQFAFSDGPIAGHADGVIVSGPSGVGLPYPVLWEAKGLNDRSWSDLVKNGLQTAHPTYFGQIHLYMGYLGLAACLFTALNKNSCEIYHELVFYDRAEAQRLVDRAVDIIRGALLPRIAAAPVQRCDYCKFKTTCWRPNA